MTATIIDGKAIAEQVHTAVAAEVAALPIAPGLATVLVGDDPASQIYVTMKRRRCVAAGMRDLHRPVPADVTQSELAAVLDELAADPDVHGILLQLPLPRGLDSAPLLARMPPHKDVDGLTEQSAGLLALGRPGLRPCTPSGVMHLLEASGVTLAGAEVAVVGRSALVGKPQAQLLLAADATVTMCHSRTRDLAAVTRRAEVLVAAAGVPQLIGPGDVRPGAIVIDVGIHRRDDGSLCGDVAPEVREIASAITPVPGGVGPMTIAMLLRNTVIAARTSLSETAATR